ncbi:MAG: imelysin family protein [Bacteroidota bacterium]
MKKLISFFLLLAITFTIVECKKKKGLEAEDEEVSFDKSGMLSNYSFNVIIPHIQSAKNALDSFASTYNQFKANKNVQTLLNARQKFIAAYEGYQKMELFGMGPAENEIVYANFNTFPTDSVQILSNITNGGYNLATVSNLDAKGLPALDYLLNSPGYSDAQVVDLFVNSPSRENYITDCLNDMQSKTANILNGWNGGYSSTFNSSTGSEIGSSLGVMVNNLNFQVDLMKNAKLGIPLGKKSLGQKLPEKCEAFYTNTISVSLIKNCLNTIENAYLGRSLNGSDGLGLDDYLDALGAQHNSGTLNEAIKNQFAVTRSKLNLINEPLSVSVMNDEATVDAAYMEIVKLLVLLKTDMPSAMGIVITYQDGDGD